MGLGTLALASQLLLGTSAALQHTHHPTTPSAVIATSATRARTNLAVVMASPLRIRQRVASLVKPNAKAGAPDSPSSAVQDAELAAADAPRFLSDDVCLVPGEPVVRIEAAPGNARRIFTGIDIVARCADVTSVVWDLLTDYERLPDAVPNLIENKVVDRFDCGGARLSQVGAAKIAPMVSFRAATTLDVRLYPSGLPAEMEEEHLEDDAAEALPLVEGIFPRPYSISALPHRDISMQAVGGAGDFSFYQGVWRLQELPACAPPGCSAMRLTYSVELRPSAPVPVRLLEGKIGSTLAENLISVREFVSADR